MFSLNRSERFLLSLPPGLNCSNDKLLPPKYEISGPERVKINKNITGLLETYFENLYIFVYDLFWVPDATDNCQTDNQTVSGQGYHYVYRMSDVYQITPHGNLDSGFQLGLPSNNKNITLIVEWMAIFSLSFVCLGRNILNRAFWKKITRSIFNTFLPII